MTCPQCTCLGNLLAVRGCVRMCVHKPCSPESFPLSFACIRVLTRSPAAVMHDCERAAAGFSRARLPLSRPCEALEQKFVLYHLGCLGEASSAILGAHTRNPSLSCARTHICKQSAPRAHTNTPQHAHTHTLSLARALSAPQSRALDSTLGGQETASSA